MLSSYPKIGVELHTREEANDGIKSVKSRAYERHTQELLKVLGFPKHVSYLKLSRRSELLSYNYVRHGVGTA